MCKLLKQNQYNKNGKLYILNLKEVDVLKTPSVL